MSTKARPRSAASRNRTVTPRGKRSDDAAGRERASPLGIVAALVLAAMLIAPIAVWGNPYPPEVATYWTWGSLLLAAATPAMLTKPLAGVRSVAHGVTDRVKRMPPGRFAATMGLVTGLFAVLLAVYAFRRGPSTSDELAMLWHAKMLLHGRLSLPVDPNREFFSLDAVVDTGRWYSQFPIGGPLMLAIGALFGTPWIVNPVLVGGAAAALYHFARRAYDEPVARSAAILFALAPMVLIMAGTWMNQVPVMFLATCALATLVEWERAATPRRRAASAGMLGLLVGLIATIRPLDAVVVALVIGSFQLSVIRHEPKRWRELIVQVVCGGLGAAPLLLANWATTGSPLTFGYDVSWGPGHRVGFHADPYGRVHTLGHATDLAVSYVGELNMYLMAWPIPVLAILVFALLVTRSVTRWDALLLGFFAAQVAAYAAYWGEGEFLGPRFLYTALPAVIVLLARAPGFLKERFGAVGQRAVISVMAVSCAVAWAMPASAFSVWGLIRQVRTVRELFKVDIAAAVRTAEIHHALVFAREPFGDRLERRLWGLGIMRSDAAQLIASRDACSLLSAVQGAEQDSSAQRSQRAAELIAAAAAYAAGPSSVSATDPRIHITSPEVVTASCRAELEADAQLGSAPFGPTLPLEPIDSMGRVDGDVIYVADLLEHNSVLRARFADRRWYRLVLARGTDQRLAAKIVPY